MTTESPFDGYWTTDVEITSHARDGFTLDVNGTEILFKQRDHVPILLEIWIEGESRNPSFALAISAFGLVDDDLVDALDELGAVIRGATVHESTAQVELGGVV